MRHSFLSSTTSTNSTTAIIGKNLESPAEGAKWNWQGEWSKDDLPVLSHCSEIYWAYWTRDNPNPKNLRIYGAHNVVNDATSQLVARAFRNTGVEKLTSWPGSSFGIDSPEGLALIGTLVLTRVVWMGMKSGLMLRLYRLTYRRDHGAHACRAQS